MKRQVDRIYGQLIKRGKLLGSHNGKKLKKADMHVHTSFSKEYVPGGKTKYYGWEKLMNFLVFIFSLREKIIGSGKFKMPNLKKYELYSYLPYSPKKVYDDAIKAGMDYVVITDHDTIEGALSLLDQYPELKDKVIVGEEVSSRLDKKGYEIHIGVYDINKKQHEEIQSKKHHAQTLVNYLKKEKILFALNHISAYNWQQIKPISKKQVQQCINMFDIIEVRNGIMGEYHNKLSEILAKLFDKGITAGTDTHCLRAGRTYTAAYADSKKEFLDQIRKKQSFVFGKHGSIDIMKDEVMDKFIHYDNFFIDGQKIFEKRKKLYDFIFRKIGTRTVAQLNSFVGMQMEHQNLLSVYRYVRKQTKTPFTLNTVRSLFAKNR